MYLERKKLTSLKSYLPNGLVHVGRGVVILSGFLCTCQSVFCSAVYIFILYDWRLLCEGAIASCDMYVLSHDRNIFLNRKAIPLKYARHRCIFRTCGGMTQAGCQVPTKGTLPLLSLSGKGRKKIYIKAWEGQGGITHHLLPQEKQTLLGENNLLQIKSE